MEPLERLMDAAKRGDIEGVRAIAKEHPELLNGRDGTGATALHYAAFDGRQELAESLVKMGADVNARDNRFRATPAGWAIEYLREMGALLGIELEDFAFAIRRGDAAWVERFLRRFPHLREEKDRDGKTFRSLAAETANPEIMRLFDANVTR